MLTQKLSAVLGLLSAVVVFTTAARRLRLPYPSLLALGGLVLALIPGLPRLELSPDVVLLVFIPPLLFGAGWRLSWGELVAQARPITLLGVGLVVFTTLGVGVAAHALDPSLPLSAAMVLGAIVSPTDPLAASAVARQVRLPRRLITILEGESLANDASGLVVYRIAVGAVVTGTFSLLDGPYTFAVTAGGGIAIGLGIGLVSVLLQRAVDDPPIQFALQLLTGYGAYLPAERMGFSGVFAAAAAGLFCGYHWSHALGARSRLQAVAVWETLDFLLNAVLFLLLGLQLPVVLAEAGNHELTRLLLTGLGVSLLAIALRLGWMFAAEPLVHADAPEPPLEQPRLSRALALLGWSGMRGVLSLAMALAVPRQVSSGAPFPGRAEILFYAFCVIAVTLIVQGLPLPFVIRWLKIPRDVPRHDEDLLARVHIARTARDHLDQLQVEGEKDELMRSVLDEFRERHRRLLLNLETEARKGAQGRTQAAIGRVRRALAQAQREALLELYRRRLIGEDTFRRIERELDLEQSD